MPRSVAASGVPVGPPGTPLVIGMITPPAPYFSPAAMHSVAETHATPSSCVPSGVALGVPTTPLAIGITLVLLLAWFGCCTNSKATHEVVPGAHETAVTEPPTFCGAPGEPLVIATSEPALALPAEAAS